MATDGKQRVASQLDLKVQPMKQKTNEIANENKLKNNHEKREMDILSITTSLHVLNGKLKIMKTSE